ncbi:MAG: hypothetical protein SGPRY_012366 [Prymnesium sp.]
MRFLSSLSEEMQAKVLRLALSDEGQRLLHAMLRDCGVRRLGARQQAVNALREYSLQLPEASTPLDTPSEEPTSKLCSSSSEEGVKCALTPSLPPPGHTAFSWGAGDSTVPVPVGHTPFSWGAEGNIRRGVSSASGSTADLPPGTRAHAHSANALASGARTHAKDLMLSFSDQLRPVADEDKRLCFACRKEMPLSSFSKKMQQYSGFQRRCISCDFTKRDKAGRVLFDTAVAATTHIQAHIRGALLRRGSEQTTAASSHGTYGHAGDAEEHAQRGCVATEEGQTLDEALPCAKDIALSGAVALYDQMALVGIAPPALAKLRGSLPSLVVAAYSGEAQEILQALQAAGVSHPEQLKRCTKALVELVGISSSATEVSSQQEHSKRGNVNDRKTDREVEGGVLV